MEGILNPGKGGREGQECQKNFAQHILKAE